MDQIKVGPCDVIVENLRRPAFDVLLLSIPFGSLNRSIEADFREKSHRPAHGCEFMSREALDAPRPGRSMDEGIRAKLA
jgi:hypothetical protein